MRPLAAALDANLLVLWRGRPVEESFLTLYIRCGLKPRRSSAFVFAAALAHTRPRLPLPCAPPRAVAHPRRPRSLVSALLETPAALKSKGVKAALCDIVTAVAVKCVAPSFEHSGGSAMYARPDARSITRHCAGTGSW